MSVDSSKSNPELGRAILAAVENQIRDNDPPETRQTFQRLQDEGYTADEARRLVSAAVAIEIFHVLNDNEIFNHKRFQWNLAHLPQEPWDPQGNEVYPG